MSSIAPLALALVLGCLARSTSASAAEPARGPALPGCGIAYPGGYDVNTVGTLQGELLELSLSDDGPVRLIVLAAGERWVVLASPAWFWKMTDLRLEPGAHMTVHGSKTLGADGSLYLIAADVVSEASGVSVTFRDRSGAPLWRDVGHGRGRMSGGGSGSGGSSGMGHGPGGGRGRR